MLYSRLVMLGVVAAMTCALAGAAVAEGPPRPPTEPIESPLLQPGWHLISIPAQPADPSPQEVFKDSAGLPIPISGNLLRFDAESQRYIPYWSFAPQDFGRCHTGDGYWLHLSAPTTIRYEGTTHIGDQILETHSKRNGWVLIGNPFNYPVPVGCCLMYHRWTGERLHFRLASGRDGWIVLPMFYYETRERRYRTCGVSRRDDDRTLRPWRGYWLRQTDELVCPAMPGPLRADIIYR